VIKAGEMFSTFVETKWTVTDLVHATKEAEKRGGEPGTTELFFVVRAVLWNPKGERLVGEKHVMTFSINHKDRSSRGETFNERSFRVTKDLGRITHQSVKHIN